MSNRDSLDSRYVSEFINATGHSSNITSSGTPPSLTSGTACTDTGHDGMTDVWELAHGLTPGDPTNATKIAPNGYTYLENYLNATNPNVAVTTNTSSATTP